MAVLKKAQFEKNQRQMPGPVKSQNCKVTTSEISMWILQQEVSIFVLTDFFSLRLLKSHNFYHEKMSQLD